MQAEDYSGEEAIGAEEAEALRPKMANRRAATTNPSGNPILRFCGRARHCGGIGAGEVVLAVGGGRAALVAWWSCAARGGRRSVGGRARGLRRKEQELLLVLRVLRPCGLFPLGHGLWLAVECWATKICSCRVDRHICFSGAAKRVRLKTRPACNPNEM